MRILIIEDDPQISNVVHRCLVEFHYLVDVAADGPEGLEMALCSDYDLIILDIMLPGMSGLEVCRRLREQECAIPLLMLTALSSREDVIRGLDRGADDYLPKPFDLEILMARVRSLIRRTSDQKSAVVNIGELTLDTTGRRVQRSGEQVILTSKEFALLEYFAMNQGRVLSRSDISEHVWDMNFDPRSNVIDSLVRCLRQKIDRPGLESVIRTVRGEGYRLDSVSQAM